MPSKCEFTVAPANGAGGTAVIHIRGEVDGEAKAPFPVAYADAVATGEPATVLLDFAEVDYINSTGIAVIVGVLARARADRLRVSAAGLSDHYKHIFTITRLVDFIHLVDSANPATSV
jgi:anti-sigma B factor antagonist